MDQHFAVDSTDVYAPGQWLGTGTNQPKDIAPAPPQMTPEDMILRAASQLQTGREFSLDPHQSANISFSQHASISRQSISTDSFGGNASYIDPDSQMLDTNDDGDSVIGMPGGQKPGSKSSANNEKEMQQLFSANKHRSLQDVAEELHGNERGPNSERTRQVFAMLWYVFLASPAQIQIVLDYFHRVVRIRKAVS